MSSSLVPVAMQRLLLIDLGLKSFTWPTEGDLNILSEDLSFFFFFFLNPLFCMQENAKQRKVAK